MPEYILDWNKYTDTAIRVAQEGSVLLKNDRSALPLKSGAKVAVFGRLQNNYYKSGTGSGGISKLSLPSEATASSSAITGREPAAATAAAGRVRFSTS